MDLYIIILGVVLAYFLKNKFSKLRKILFLFDAIGISLFTIQGLQIAQKYDLNGIYLILFGVITATFGGALRDILCDEIPLIFRKEIYATACVLGALSYIGLEGFGISIILKTIISCLIIIIIRIIAIIKNLRIPIS
jgi:uncharacterized membrane protein YeiH